eukprot:CAMPEP_0172445058 /NCGR_PEP_ID=MMETSP1065-20121228/5032_1 /TAXON_ID=265537 /ORGANISM="Amphiprora paludosa, Strain CCMP125" /LENGTH=190 /DNA_ID=CAMNT_0013195851 /DNA_START=10 /DNA_END=582 /DNA_ORIENTATION=+
MTSVSSLSAADGASSVSLDQDVWVQTVPNKRISSLSLVSISELEALEQYDNEPTKSSSSSSISLVNAKSSRRASGTSMEQTLASQVEEGEYEDESTTKNAHHQQLEGANRSSWDSIDDDTFLESLDMIGGIRDSLQAKHAKTATFKKPHFGSGDEEPDQADKDEEDSTTVSKSGKEPTKKSPETTEEKSA